MTDVSERPPGRPGGVRSRARQHGVAGLDGATEAPRVCGLSLATPEARYGQPQMLELLGLAGDPFAERIFARSGVRQRAFALDPQLFGTTMQARAATTERRLLELALEAVAGLDTDPDEIGVVVGSTFYTLGVPSLAQQVADRLGLHPDVDCYHVTAAGCASVVPLFRLANQALRDHPGKRALVLAADCLGAFLTRFDGDASDRTKVVGSALFGDGCGAALLAGDHDAPGPAILGSQLHRAPGTTGHVHFDTDASDSVLRLSRELPAITERAAGELVDDFLRAHGLGPDAIDHWLVHPGGAGIIGGAQRGLGLTDDQVATSRHVLAEHGNVGTPASFYVLDAAVARDRPASGEHGLVLTVGPGVTVGLMLLAW